jgi:GPH family glycoside/pentoside/hexuronide:cation symporter
MVEEGFTQTEVKRYPKGIITSFQFGNLVGLMMSQMYSQQLTYFYLGVVNMDITFYLIAMIIYMVFNMFNDPLLGYFCDKSTRFIERWGKRFPFIVISIPWCFIVIFLYMPPSVDEIGQFGIFLWFLIFLCIYDMIFSLFDINRTGLFPDKFRDNQDRKWGGMITTVLETIGILLGVLIPVLTIEFYGQDLGWRIQAIIISLVAFVFLVLMIPGVREDQEMRQRRSRVDKILTEPFIKGLKSSMRDKHFAGFMILYVAYTSTMGLVMASIPFLVQDILQLSKIGELVVLCYIIAAIIGAPFWYKVSTKLGIKRVTLIGAILLACMGMPFLFIPLGPEGLIFVIIVFTIAGFVDAAIITMTMPLFSSVIDNATIETGRRREGLYKGVWLFFSRVGLAIRAIVFWLVQITFGYHSGSTDPYELMGLRFQLSVFPMIISGLGILVFWRLYQITPQQLELNIEKLKELKL